MIGKATQLFRLVTQVRGHRRGYKSKVGGFLDLWNSIVFLVLATKLLQRCQSFHQRVHIDRSVRLRVTVCVYLFLSFLVLPFSQETDYSSAPCPAPLHLHHDTPQQLTSISLHLILHTPQAADLP